MEGDKRELSKGKKRRKYMGFKKEKVEEKKNRLMENVKKM
jgi:hypothetical protein